MHVGSYESFVALHSSSQLFLSVLFYVSVLARTFQIPVLLRLSTMEDVLPDHRVPLKRAWGTQ